MDAKTVFLGIPMVFAEVGLISARSLIARRAETSKPAHQRRGSPLAPMGDEWEKDLSQQG